MKIKYRQQRDVTLVSMLDDTLVGVSSCRPDDIFRAELGLAVAIIKASKRVPLKEMHFVEQLDGAPWRTVTINQRVFGFMLQNMLGYRIACGEPRGPAISISVMDLLPRVVDNIESSSWKQGSATIKTKPPDCVIAERIGRDLLGRVDLRSKMRF